jgi:hypothetical protein
MRWNAWDCEHKAQSASQPVAACNCSKKTYGQSTAGAQRFSTLP